MDHPVMKLRDHPALAEQAASWFHSKWGVPREAYLQSIQACLRGGAPIPQWYVLLEGDRIIAGAGVIEHDFHLRKDISPNVYALYVEEPWRNRGLAGRLLNLICEDVAALGVETLYLVTEHTAFYERYGWEFFCLAQEENSPSWLRRYRRTTASPLQ